MRETLVKSEEFKDSPVGRVPKNWKVVNLASVCQRITDGSHQSVKTSDEGVPFLYVSCVRDGQILWEQAAKITETTYSEISKGREPKPGLILYTAVGSYGHAALVRENCKFSFQRHIAYILPNAESVAPEYLVRWLNSPQGRKYADQVALGNAQKTVTLSSLADFPVLLPSLEEQEGIAAILNSIDQAISHTSSLIAKLKQMKAGLLHDLLTRGLDENGELRDAIAHPEQFKPSLLGQIPKEWEAEPFGEHIAQLDSGWSPVCDSEPAVNGERGILKTTAVVWSGYNPLESKKLPSNLQPRYQAVVEADDILITRKGPRERVGVVVHIPLTPPQLMMPDTVFRVRLKESSTLLPAFVPLTLGSIVVQRDWNRKKIGLAEAQVDINYGIVRETLIYIPPKPEQERIVALVN